MASAGDRPRLHPKASQSLADYFVSGRSLPWWLAGTSMVATTFAADTPLVVAGLVAKYGVAGNWLWWNGAFSGILTVFFFARLWRRAGVLTDLEFAELRYGGKPAAVLRGFRALYLALPINLIIMGWVTRAMVTILQISLNIDPWTAAIAAVRRHRALHHLLGPLGRGRDRHVSVRREDGRRHRARGVRREFGRRPGRAGPPGRGPLRLVRSRLRRAPADRQGLAAALDALVVSRASSGGRPGIRAPSRAAADTSRSGSSRRRDERHGLLATLWFQIAHYAAAAVAVDPGRLRRGAALSQPGATRRRDTSRSWSTSCPPL